MKINNKLLNTNIITAKLQSDTSVTATSGIIPLSTSTIVGNKLTFLSTENKIIIGAGVSKVKVSGNMRVSTAGSTSIGINLNIFKNNSAYISSNRTSLSGNGYDGLSTAPKVIDVEEGDTIHMAYWKGNSTQTVSILGNTYGATYLTVEVVE